MPGLFTVIPPVSSVIPPVSYVIPPVSSVIPSEVEESSYLNRRFSPFYFQIVSICPSQDLRCLNPGSFLPPFPLLQIS